MKKKAIEKIPYFGLKKTSRKKDVKYIGVTAVKIVGHEKHLFLEVYRNKKESKEMPMVRIVLTKKDFGTYWPEKEEWTRQKIKPDSCYGRERADRRNRSHRGGIWYQKRVHGQAVRAGNGGIYG